MHIDDRNRNLSHQSKGSVPQCKLKMSMKYEVEYIFTKQIKGNKEQNCYHEGPASVGRFVRHYQYSLERKRDLLDILLSPSPSMYIQRERDITSLCLSLCRLQRRKTEREREREQPTVCWKYSVGEIRDGWNKKKLQRCGSVISRPTGCTHQI